MSNFKQKTQVPTEVEIVLYNGRPCKNGGTPEQSTPIGGTFATLTLPAASGLADGLLAYDSTRQALVTTFSGAWVLP